ncbi:P-loop containing nucleoside triphosphate hydrolase protein [Gyrodon lividus]|nr:P-loop containing nucleoside triphosphate hydrolase protein [Gyrodon lividus]
MASLPAQFTENLRKFGITLDDAALNYLTSMLEVMSTSDVVPDTSRLRESTEMFLDEAEVDPRRMDEFYRALDAGPKESKQPARVSEPPLAAPTAPLTETKPLSVVVARRQKRAQKKAAAAAVASSASPAPESSIVATSQQSRFYKETLSTLSKDIDMQTVNISVNNLDLLVDAHLRLKEGVRYGLIGQNGVGKTVLMKCMAEDILAMPNNLNILHIAQLETFDESATALTSVLEADRKPMDALREYEELHAVLGADATFARAQPNTAQLNIVIHKILLSRLAATLATARQLAIKRSGQRGYEARQRQVQLEAEYAELEAQDPQTYVTAEMTTEIITDVVDKHALTDLEAKRATARKILRGIGFMEREVDAPVGTLSGGWRMKIALAKSLFLRPDVLLLDEPTNHLDLPAILWLQEYLKAEVDGITLVVVSHDREFLDNITEETIIFRDKSLTYHAGNFSDYVQNTEEQRVRKQALLDTQEKKRARIVASIQHNVQQARTTGDDKRLGQVASRKKKLDRLGMEKTEDGKRFKISYWAGYHDAARVQIEVDRGVKTASLKVPEPEPLRYSGPVLTLTDASFRYPGQTNDVIKQSSIDVRPGARIAFLGPNGCGKTTLLNLLTGVTRPTAGEVYHHPRLRIGYFSQHVVDSLELSRTPIAEMMARHRDVTEHECRAHFGSVGVSGDVVLRPISSLSGGQRNRVAFALVLYDAPHVLVLDEITNHLDMGTVERLVEALQGFSGALVLVSHDLWFLRELMEGFEDEEDEGDMEEEGRKGVFYVVGRGSVKRWEGDLDSYVASVMRKVRKGMTV